MITAADVVLALSNSGETDELLTILPVIKRLDVPLIALTGKAGSTLARYATVTLDVRGLACPVPSLKMTKAVMKKEVEEGDILEVLADCSTFEQDVKTWCAAMSKVLIFMRDEPENAKRCQVRI